MVSYSGFDKHEKRSPLLRTVSRSMDQCTRQGLSNLRGKAGGGKDQGIVVPPADGRNSSYPFANLVPQDGSGKAFERTPDEVLPPVHMLQCMPAHVPMTLTQQPPLLPPVSMLR